MRRRWHVLAALLAVVLAAGGQARAQGLMADMS